MSVEGAPLIDQVLCVTTDNSPIAGSYLGAQGVVAADTLAVAGVARAATFIAPARGLPSTAVTAAALSGIYVPGERVAAAVATTPGAATLRSVSSGWWALPAAGPAGTCASGAASFARFRTAVAPAQCARPPAALSAASCEALSATRLVSSLYLGKTPAAAPAAPADWAAVGVASVTRVDFASGATAPGTAAALASAFTTDPAGCACAGAVTGVSYIATYDGTLNVLTGVTADVTVANISLPLAACAGGAAPALLSVPVTVAVAWVDGAAAASAAPAHPDARSGAPGYAPLAPVLAGVLIAQSGGAAPFASGDKLAIARSAPAGSRLAPLARLDAGSGFASAGLTLRGAAADGSCAALPATGAPDAAAALPVRFGQDLSAACALSLDYPAFAALCATAGGTLPYLGLWAVNASATGGAPVAATHVGTFGNADVWKAHQWTPITAGAAPSAAATLDGVRGTCAGVTAALHVEFLTAAVGEAGNPQQEIIAARTTLAVDTWAFTREDVRTTLDAGSPPAYGKQKFLLTTTVTWHAMPPAARADYVAPVPPVIPSVPSDLWVPFA